MLALKSEVISLTKPNIFLLWSVAQLRAREIVKNTKRCTSSINLPFLVFQNLILNCGPIKRTLLVPSYRLTFFLHSWRGGDMCCRLTEGSLMWDRGRLGEWQCAGILCRQCLRQKKNISTYITCRKEKKLKKAEEENDLEPERVHARHLDLRLNALIQSVTLTLAPPIRYF